MKKLKLLLLLAGVLMALPVVARDFSFEHEGHTITYTIIDQDARICMTKAGSSAAPGNEVEGSLTLPANPVDGTTTYTLTAIGDYSFAKCGSLSAISIPNTVTTIGVQAFRSCTGLTSVVIPPSVTDLDDDAFWLCTGLEKSAYPEHLYNPFESGVVIKYPAEATITADGCVYSSDMTMLYFAPLRLYGEFIIPSTVTTVAQSALQDCNALTKIVIPPSVTTIESQAFKGCGFLSEVTFEDGNNPFSLSSDAFTDSYISKLYMGRDWIVSGNESPFTGIISSLTLGNAISVIPAYAFSDCNSLTSVVISNSVTSIGEYAFNGCSSLSGELIIPNSVETIGNSAFKGCSGLTSVIIGNSLKTIGDCAFDGCGGLTSLVFGDSVTYIGEYAFRGCHYLTSVTIPSSVTEIWNTAFMDCSNLTLMKMLCNVPPQISGWVFSYQTPQMNLPNTTLEVPTTDIVALAEYFGWWHFKSIIADGNPTKSYSTGGITYYLIENPDNREAVILGHESTTAINIPERITDLSDSDNPVRYYVAGIAPEAFKDDKQIQTVTFDSRTKISCIPTMAFFGCSSLKSITIPGSVTSIGYRAFFSCSGLTGELIIPNSVETIGSGAFASYDQKSDLTSVIIGNTVKTIGDDAFNGCSRLTSVEIGNSVKTIGQGAFAGCSGLTSIDIPNSVETIEYGGFYGCKSLTSVVIGNSVKTIGDMAFYNCDGLTSVVIGNSVETIGKSAFNGCNSLKKVDFGSVESLCNIKFEDYTSNPLRLCPEHLYINGEEVTDLVIPEGVTAIGDNLFSGCSGLNSVVIPNSVETIGKSAFNGCSNMTSVVIGNSVTSIGEYAFNGCNSLKKVDFGSVESLCNIKFEDYYSNPLRYCRDNLYINGEEVTDLVIPEGVTAIGDNLFYYCSGLKSVVIGNSVETIGDEAFRGCSGLKSVLIGNSVKTIGENAFSGCYPYKSAYPNTIENPIGSTSICYPAESAIIENGVVFGPDKLTIYFVPMSLKGEFKIPDSVTSIGDQAFSGCTDLTSVEFGNSFKTIGEEAFSGCSGLTGELIIPNSVTSIGDHTFYGCSGLNSVVIGNSVETINEGAFQGCTGLTSIIIPNSVTSIDGWAFQGCTGLTSIIIGNSVKTIGECAFRDCTALTSAVIGNSVQTIGNEAFKSCRSLKYVFSLNPEAPSIDGNALRDIPNDAILYVPKGSVEKYAYATGWYRIYDIRELDSLLGLTISEQNVRVEVGEAAELTVAAVSDVPSDLEPFIVAGSEQWMSDNEAVATVEDGVVKAIGAGTTTITYSVEDRFGYTHSVECEVKVPYMRGDANGNNSLAVNDVILTARGVVNDLDPALVMEAVDMNGDDALTVGDLTLVVNAVISYEVPAKGAERNYQRAMEADGMASPLLLTQNGSEINVAFDGDGRFTGVQFDVVGDDGLSVTSVTLAGAAIQSHSAANHRLETGAMRMLAYGTETFAANGTFATIHTESADMQPCTLTITNVMAGDFNGNLYRLPDCGIDVLSQAGVAAVTNGSLNIAVEGRTLVITSGEDTTVVISDMKGITTTLEIEAGVTRHTLTTAGAYIVNNNKIMIR